MYFTLLVKEAPAEQFLELVGGGCDISGEVHEEEETGGQASAHQRQVRIQEAGHYVAGHDQETVQQTAKAAGQETVKHQDIGEGYAHRCAGLMGRK